jgi:hypothetical protein
MFRKSVIVVLLLITPFAQARAVLVCSMMNEAPVERCVCPELHHEQMPHSPADHSKCCNVVIEVGHREFASSTFSTASALPQMAAWADVPGIELNLIESPPALAAADVSATSESVALRALSNAPPLYLGTARLRL